ncbi:DUF4861 family protein [Flavobacterium sp.]|uniref:DUF4861 family protein n=1 Tax=Flavobacterium sp. TaxID=239 RepID=UPI002621C8C9|nr:DUF4861 family protein [Flavobacterium sp.]
MNCNTLSQIFCLLCFFIGWSAAAQSVKVSVENTLDFDRVEVAAIEKASLSGFLARHDKKHLRIKREGTEAFLPIQWTDYDGDGNPDALLFQAFVPAKSTTNYVIVSDSIKKISRTEIKAYCKFNPDRDHDVAWENDKVAFRAYGQKKQKQSKKAALDVGSSGICPLLKKVNYAVLDDWYAKDKKSAGYSHTDQGEGYDGYSMGNGRGIGGTGLWLNDTLQVPKRFSECRIVDNGPLRVTFELVYEAWSTHLVEETKRISMDLGSNFSRFDVYFTSNTKAPNYAIGISLHQNTGQAKADREKGLFRYWETIDGVPIGTGLIVEPKLVADALTHTDPDPDQSHLLVVTKPRDRLSYYAGFAWQKSGQANTAADWDGLMEKQLLVLQNPLRVTTY